MALKIDGVIGNNLHCTDGVAIVLTSSIVLSSYAWSLAAYPDGSAAALTGAATATAGLTPDMPGTWLIECTDGTNVYRVALAVRLPTTGLRPIASGENLARWGIDWTEDDGDVAREVEAHAARILPAASAAGRTVYDTGAAWSALAAGTEGKVLTAHGAAAPTWETPDPGETRITTVALTDAATIATDASVANVGTVTLGGSRLMGNPTGSPAVGQRYTWIVTQDGTGSRYLSFDTGFLWPNGIAPLSTTTAGAVDVYDGVYTSAGWAMSSRMATDNIDARAALLALSPLGLWLAADCRTGTLTTAPDASGNAYTMTATDMTVALRNGRKVFAFTGNTSQMTNGSVAFAGDTSISMAAIGLDATPGSSNMLLETGTNGGNTAGGFSFYKSNSMIEGFYTSPEQYKQSSSTHTGWGRFAATIDTTQAAADEFKLYANDVEPAYGINTANETTQGFSTARLTIGGRYSVTTHALTGSWAAFAIFPSALSAAQRATVDACLLCFGGAS